MDFRQLFSEPGLRCESRRRVNEIAVDTATEKGDPESGISLSVPGQEIEIRPEGRWE